MMLNEINNFEPPTSSIGVLESQVLKNKVVSVVGAGALGSVLANHLVRLGIGEIRIVDRDFVEESNLQRQMLYDEEDALRHTPKALAAMKKLQAINPQVMIKAFVQDINSETIEELLRDSDLILDGTDNLSTRFLINDLSIKYEIPWVYGGAIHSRGMTMPVYPNITPCFRCIFHFSEEEQEAGDTCDTVGVISPIIHSIASLQIIQALKILTGNFTKEDAMLRQIDLWQNDYDSISLEHSRNFECLCCQQKHFTFLHRIRTEPHVTQLCGRNTIQVTPAQKHHIDFNQLERKWRELGSVENNLFLLRLISKDYTITLFKDGRALIQGTNNLSEAKRIYADLI